MANPLDPTPPTPRAAAGGDRPERRRPRVLGADRNPRAAAAQYVVRNRLEGFERALVGLAVAVFGGEASVVPHLRANGRRQQLVFVVDAADPTANVDYEGFLEREQTFWTAYAHVPKPDVPFAVAIRPARGWCRTEALAPFFAFLPSVEDAT
jgi:hypothetical protein